MFREQSRFQARCSENSQDSKLGVPRTVGIWIEAYQNLAISAWNPAWNLYLLLEISYLQCSWNCLACLAWNWLKLLSCMKPYTYRLCAISFIKWYFPIKVFPTTLYVLLSYYRLILRTVMLERLFLLEWMLAIQGCPLPGVYQPPLGPCMDQVREGRNVTCECSYHWDVAL